MYSRQEAAQLKQEFWSRFGQYMAPVLSADGEKINWINYKTGEKDIYFKMEADNKEAFIAIEVTHKDLEIQQMYFEQFAELRAILESFTGEAWDWQLLLSTDHGKKVSRIYSELTGVSIFKKEDWPQLISFFKPRIQALDEFWTSVKHRFSDLR
jgi:hypothetical protein